MPSTIHGTFVLCFNQDATTATSVMITPPPARVPRSIVVTLQARPTSRPYYLIEATRLLETCRAERVEQPERADAIGLSRVLGHLERDLDVRHRAEVVYLDRSHDRDDVEEVSGVRKVAIMKGKAHIVRVVVLCRTHFDNAG